MNHSGSRADEGPHRGERRDAPLVVDGESLTLAAIAEVARRARPVCLARRARERLAAGRRRVEEAVASGEILYGVTTGFGKLADVAISSADARRLQENLIRSHAAGVGPALPVPVVRAMMLLRANALARGYSGVRPELVEMLLAMLNRGVHPVVPSRGSLGASGDLAPLAHLALVLIGRGEAEVAGERLPGAEALARAGLAPLELAPKEGLALINGTQAMTALGSLAVEEGLYLAAVADVAGALTLQALRGIPAAFDPRIHALRPHPGQQAAAAHLRRLLAGSRLVTRPGEVRVQDAYALRCMPQVHGAVRDALTHAATVLVTEANAVTDNPLVFPDGDVLSGGNFHGEPVALVLDYAAAALAELGNIAERRIERLVNPQLSGLPAFLTRQGGLHSGLMLAQYTAAALVSENKTLAVPASVDSIPSSANQEDHVSMGMISALKLWRVVEHTRYILAIELLCAAQALEFVGPAGLSPATAAAYRAVREAVPPLAGDRELAPDIEALAARLAERRVPAEEPVPPAGGRVLPAAAPAPGGDGAG